jgi:hypothetical protein
MWVLRVHNVDDDELVAEHDLGADDAAPALILPFEPTKEGSMPLDLVASGGGLIEPAVEQWVSVDLANTSPACERLEPTVGRG